MATQAGGITQDQNLKFQFDGVQRGVKSNVSKAQKQGGGLGGRRALNDISNSGRHSTLQTSKKHNSKNAISVNESKPPEKEKVQAFVGRKALGDLTNSGKPHLHQASKKNHGKKLSAVVEEQILPHAIVEEQFLHNHQECIKAQGKAMDLDYFLKTVGLDKDNSILLDSPSVSPLSRKWKLESPPPRYLEMEEISELLVDQLHTELPSIQTPCGTLKSPKPVMQWKDYKVPDFMLIETPKMPKD